MTARALLAAVLLTSLTIPVCAADARNDDAPTAVILCYHIVESPQDPRMEISRDAFLQQMRYLAMTGYNVIPLRHVYEYAIGKRASLPKNAIVVTIDDGWRSTYTEVFPEMQKRNFPFTVFVYPKIIGQTSHALSWKQVKEMADAGVDIQSHSLSHPFLTQRRHESFGDAQYEVWLQRELSESKRILERETGHKVSFLAYPYGDYDHHLAAAVARAGYAAALTCDFGRVHHGSDPMRMKRFVIDKRMDFAAFRHYLGAGEMKIEGVTPIPGHVVEPVQQPLVVSARIPNYKQLDPTSVGMVVLSSAAAVPFNYDARDGSIRLVVRDALDALKGQYLRALVWANDVKSGKRVEATWTFRIPDPAANLPQVPPRSIQRSIGAPAAPASSEPLQPKPAEQTKASTAVAAADGAGGMADVKGSRTRADRAPK
jgi:peptidoglycan/xylan/chitin deacetylase (PgdA/CDA1 family)